MLERRQDDSPWPHSRSVRGITTSNQTTQGCGGPLVAAAAIIRALSQRKQNNQDKLLVDLNVEKNLGIDLKQLEIFSLEDLQVATDNFSNKIFLGGGAFGTVYYKGRLSDGSFVAVKRHEKERFQEGEFEKEVFLISRAIHRNLLRLRGFCITPKERILVYPFMTNGSVASCVTNRSKSQPPLSWEIRKGIALGAARGLAYLHEDCNPKIIHRDVKPANIFLDEEFKAVVGDFGFSKELDFNDTHGSASKIVGTYMYIAPEYVFHGMVSEKIDIFGYGIMLLELVSGQKALHIAELSNEEDSVCHDWVKGLLKEKKFDTLVDADLHGDFYVDEVEDLLRIAVLCIRRSPTERPKMREIVRLLSHLLNKRSHCDPNLKTPSPTRSPHISRSLPSSSSPASVSTRTQNQQTKAQSQARKVAAREDKEMWLGNLKCFSLTEIAKATHGFDRTFILGKGAFGNVYKGKLLDGRVVAIKRQALKDKKIHIDEEHRQVGEFQFQAEIEMIGKAIHRNLLHLLGFCVTPTERILIYPFMVNGSVASWLKDGVQPLPWKIRKKIAVGAAKGLAYLHDDCKPKIIHRDVKAANILLDENFEAIVADFGLVKFLESEDSQITTAVCGTWGYIAPECFYTRRSSVRIDVFAYGRTLMEIISGKRPFDLATAANDSDITFTDWMGRLLKEKKWDILVDASLQGNYVEDEVERFIQIALLCTQHSAKKRPKMSEVITMLEGNDDGNSIDTRWKELQQLLEHEKTDQTCKNFNFSMTVDSFSYIQADELSGPR